MSLRAVLIGLAIFFVGWAAAALILMNLGRGFGPLTRRGTPVPPAMRHGGGFGRLGPVPGITITRRPPNLGPGAETYTFTGRKP